MTDGLLIVNKPKGCTSHDVINRIRKVYKIKKCGHAGTLDPMAQGVLLVFTGKALKLLSFLEKEELDKTYLMRVTLGVETESYDTEGDIVSENNEAALALSKKEITDAVNSFKGHLEQIPPIYSAVRVNGEKAYKKARAGENVALPPRPVDIYKIELIEDLVLNGHRQLIIRVDCSRGTYVRSLAHDLGVKLGCGAHLSYLRRERVGKCLVSMSYPWYNIEHGIPFDTSKAFISAENILSAPRVTVNQEGVQRIMHGNTVDRRNILKIDSPAVADKTNTDVILMLSEKNELLALYKAETKGKQKGVLKALKVMINE